MSLLIAGLLFFGVLGETAALALSGGREPHQNGTTATLDQRALQIAILSTRLDTIYLSGNPKSPRTADFGFNFHINGNVWAPCPVTAKGDRGCPGMVGSCIDNLLCPDGCGLTDGTLPTLRCTEEGKQFCSTAYLTFQKVAISDPATSYACASDQSEEIYMGFTTELQVEDFTTSTPTATITSSDATTTPGSTQSSVPKTTEPPAAGPTLGPAESNSSSPANNIGAIIGGVAGCLALVCGFGLAAVWLLRRNRNAKAKAASASSSASSDGDGDGASFDGKPELEAAGRRTTYERAELFGQSRSEMPARGPAAYDTSMYRADDRPMTPVELPTTARAGWV